MPYRRLPNTDSARLKALKSAFKKGKDLPPFKLAYSQSTFQKVQFFITKFESAITDYKNSYAIQVEKNKDYINALKKAKLYISHFIQVMNMSISRGDLPVQTRKFFGLSKEEKKLPLLSTEKDVINWGKKLIEGENQRAINSMSPITNPTIALVKVRYENFLEAYQHQKVHQQNSSRNLNKLAALRPEADDIIVSIWNEVEEHFKDINDEERRKKAAEYGLVYVFRKNELKSLKFFD